MIEDKEAAVIQTTATAKRKMGKMKDRKQIRHGKQKIRQEIARFVSTENTHPVSAQVLTNYSLYYRLEESVFRRDLGADEAASEDEALSSEFEEDHLDADTNIKSGPSKKMKAAAWLDEEDVALT